MEVPRHWRLKKQRYALVGEVCPHCEAKLFPPRDICPECGGEAKTPYVSAARVRYILLPIWSMRQGLKSKRPIPSRWSNYPKALWYSPVDRLGDQPVEIGMPVEMVTRKICNDGDERGLIIYGYKFRPVMAQ